jgi:hypothetical protein
MRESSQNACVKKTLDMKNYEQIYRSCPNMITTSVLFLHVNGSVSAKVVRTYSHCCLLQYVCLLVCSIYEP